MRNIVYLILSVWIAIFDFRTQIQTKANHIYLERERETLHAHTHAHRHYSVYNFDGTAKKTC